ncbi:MAG: transglycosylase domain-containing protein [Clostridiales bacterium]|nr:transglycosylase domain-containing protein [Clostridiales bacterium]
MNFGKKGIQKKQQRLQSKHRKIRNKSFLSAFKVFLFLMILICFVGTAAGFGIVKGIIDQSPDMSTVDVSPQGISTCVYDADGNLIQTLVTSGSNRDPVTYDQIPENLIDAFVAIEDSRFWVHHGVDLRGMFRAAAIGIRSGFRSTQGASTITQQLIKNNVFEGGAESSLGAKVVRKIQEQFLAMELEKTMSKQDIMENYLNTINLGANCLGVQTAARRYFDKDVSQLTLSECAVIAGITQNPVGYNPITHPDKNAEKRMVILSYMKEQGYITEEEEAEALNDPVYDRIQEINNKYEEEDDSPYSYFIDRLITEVLDDLQTKCNYSQAQAYSLLYSGGLEIYTTQDPEIQSIVDEEISNPENYANVSNKYSFTYSLILSRNGEAVYYSETDIKNYLGKNQLDYNTEDEIQTVVDQFRESILEPGDEILSENVSTTLQPQASIVFMEQGTGQVKAISGGRGEKTTSLSLNRATSTRRSPGSTFKVLTAFAPALDSCGGTLASTYYDEPYTDENTGKSFRNWWGSSVYAGYSNIRQGIVYSMNIVAVKTLMDTVTPRTGYEYALDFGFNTLYEKKDVNGQIFTDIQPSLALGGLTDGVTNLQLTAAYATIANKGTYTEPIFYTKIVDHNGNVLIDNTPEQHQVLKETTAFLLTDAMADSMKHSSMFGLFSATSSAAALNNMSAAGKSGTSTGKTDLWFVGYTPYYTMGIWSGFDDNTAMDGNEGSSSYHKLIWKKIMDRVDQEKHLYNREFEVPENIVICTICSKSGKLARSGVCSCDERNGYNAVYSEYFEKGTEPTEYCDLHYTVTVCEESGQKAGEFCPTTKTMVALKLPNETTGGTQDSEYAHTVSQPCSLHLTPLPPESETPDESSTSEEPQPTNPDDPQNSTSPANESKEPEEPVEDHQ